MSEYKSTGNTKSNDGKRKLLKGERQHKDGRYEYRYYDKYHKRQSIYSWKLTPSDPLPKGKKQCRALRDMEREIEKDLQDEIDTFASKKATLNARFDLYMEGKKNLEESTRCGYWYKYNTYVRPELGNMKMNEFNYSIIKNFYNDLVTKKGFKPNTVENIHTLLNPVFEDATFDGIIRINPCPKAMKEVRKMPGWNSHVVNIKDALSAEEQKRFVDFMLSDKKYARWVSVITILLGTGMRISELRGLQWDRHIDLENNDIYVEYQLQYRQWGDGRCYDKYTDLKTTSSERHIPMDEKVREAFLTERERQEKGIKKNIVIDGHTGWAFTNRYGNILSASSVNDAIQRIITDYNKMEQARVDEINKTISKKADRVKPRFLPHVTNHLLRHSFCSRLMEECCKPDSKINIKVVQVLMGHASSSTTLDIYTTVSEEFKKRTMSNIEGANYLG